MRAILTIAMLLSISSAHAQNIAARHTPDAPTPPQPKARPTDIPRFSKDTLTPWVNGNIPPARWLARPKSGTPGYRDVVVGGEVRTLPRWMAEQWVEEGKATLIPPQ